MSNTYSPALQGILLSGGSFKWVIRHLRLTFKVKMASLLLSVGKKMVSPSSDTSKKLAGKKIFYMGTTSMLLKHSLRTSWRYN